MNEQLSVFNTRFVSLQRLCRRSVRYYSFFIKLASMQAASVAVGCGGKPVFLMRALQQKSDVRFIGLLNNGDIIKRTFGMNNLQTRWRQRAYRQHDCMIHNIHLHRF